MEQILKAWSDTSTMATTFTGAYGGHSSLTVDMQGVWSPDDAQHGGDARDCGSRICHADCIDMDHKYHVS